MQYNSWFYIIWFLPVLLILYYSISIEYRWIILLIGSMVFYLMTSGKLICYICFSALTVYVTALKIDREKTLFQERKKSLQKKERKRYKEIMVQKHRIMVVLTALLNVGILLFLKYRNFMAGNLNSLFEILHSSVRIPIAQLFVPLGISFYTLAAIGYVTDVARGICPAEKNFFKLFLFLICFPVIIEGPIERYNNLGEQIKSEHSFDYKSFCFGWQLILWGLFQKIVLADRMNLLVSYVFSHYQIYTGLPVITAILMYTFQLYMDFSGCIDIARGSAQLFGIQLTENFRRPFFSSSVSEFWRRWHISLGTWLKDYIFYPVSLGKTCQRLSKACRKKLSRYYAATLPAIFALFFVWIINGIWHGAEWKYIIYGLYYYLIMVIGMLSEPLLALICKHLSINRETKAVYLLRQLRTFLLVNIGMLIFRAKDLKTAYQMFCSIFIPYHFKKGWFFWIWKRGNIRKFELLLIVGSLCFLIIYGRFKERGGHFREEFAKKPLPVRWTVYIVVVLIVVGLGAYGPGFGTNDFIYGHF